MSNFEKATRKKLRFNSTSGVLSVEDLWDLPLTGRGANLDKLAKSLHKELKESEEESFVVKTVRKDSELQLKFDIVKYIIDVKLEEQETAKNRADKKAEKELEAESFRAVVDKEKERLKSKKSIWYTVFPWKIIFVKR